MTTNEKWIVAIIGVSLLFSIMDRVHNINACYDEGSAYACAQAQQDDDHDDTMNDEARGE
jgi:hypothetical protein